MILHQGVYLPEGEIHMVDWMTKSGEIVDGRGTYQIKKLRAAVALCQDFRTAVDIGAHVGLWSMQLEKMFDHVVAFEPVEEHRDCFHKNLYGKDITLHPCALGAHDGLVKMVTPEANSSGSTMIRGDGDIPLRRLDDFELMDVDFIKLDCEGYELFALQGGAETICRDMPTIIVEQKPGRAQRFGLPETGAVTFLEGLGYHCNRNMSGDFIMLPR